MLIYPSTPNWEKQENKAMYVSLYVYGKHNYRKEATYIKIPIAAVKTMNKDAKTSGIQTSGFETMTG